MLLARSSCRFGILTPALLHILCVLEEYARAQDLTIIILSGSGGGPRPYSGDKRGEACDFRCRYLSDHHSIAELQTRLGPEFLMRHEHAGQSNEHYHVQLRRGAEYHPHVPTNVSRFNRV